MTAKSVLMRPPQGLRLEARASKNSFLFNLDIFYVLQPRTKHLMTSFNRFDDITCRRIRISKFLLFNFMLFYALPCIFVKLMFLASHVT